jgi:hypothetical protein
MGKRGRPRKNPPQEPENIGDDGENTLKQDLSSENPTEISPQELNKTDNPTENTDSSENPLEDTSTVSEKLPHDRFPLTEIPEQWNDVPILELAKQGWYYRARSTDKSGSKYMFIRNRTNERSLGQWSPELEKLFFERYPILYRPKGEAEPPEPSTGKGLGSKPFFNVPIKRIAVIPGDYRPTMDVIRYYHIYKNNGFLGDFSDFMNGIVGTHFVKCHGIVLPVYVNEELIEQHA